LVTFQIYRIDKAFISSNAVDWDKKKAPAGFK